jgi:NAD(P)-dependent dehydrogenase (short-subunit alcohol dehydrogenase family)
MRTVLVTGASTGIGRATALRLDTAGWKVFAGVRREEDANSLRSSASGSLEPVILDVTDEGQIAAVAEHLGDRLDGLVNNAGVALPSPLETMPLDDFRRQVDVNVVGQIAVTQANLPAIRTAAGRIVFVSSIGGRMALPFLGAYHAAKFAIEAVGDCFRQELRPWGISVSIVEPGSIATPIWGRGIESGDEITGRTPRQADLYGAAIERYKRVIKQTADRGIPPEKVAQAIEHALAAPHPRTRYLVGLDAKLQARLKYVVPTRVLDRVVARMVA